MILEPAFFRPGDFAPGDRALASAAEASSPAREWRFVCIRSPQDAHFEPALALLEAEFGPLGEMEHRSVIEKRLARWQDPALGAANCHALYEMVLAFAGEEPAAVRDHTVLFPPVEEGGGVLVHLSHNLVLPPWRRTGLAGWMRGCPALEARLLREEFAPGRQHDPILLVAEMEPWDENRESTMVRLKAYEKAGFGMVDPDRVHYFQPDFEADENNLDGPFQPVPFRLLMRWVGRDEVPSLPAKQVQQVMNSLLGMYGRELSAANIAFTRAAHKIVDPGKPVRLVPPTWHHAPEQ